MALPTPGLGPCSFRNGERIHFCSFKPPSLCHGSPDLSPRRCPHLPGQILAQYRVGRRPTTPPRGSLTLVRGSTYSLNSDTRSFSF